MLYGSTYPRLSHYPEHDDNTEVADKLTKFCSQIVLGGDKPLTLLPFQEHILNAATQRKGNAWSAFEVAVLVPRQSGKSLTGVIRCLFGLFVLKENIYFAAHAVRTTRKLFLEMVDIIQSNPELIKRVKGYKPGQAPDADLTGIHRGYGDMSITTKYGNTITFGSRSKGDARGLSLDLYVAEEAFALTHEQMEAILPTLSGDSANASPQIWYISSAPLPDSEVLHDIRNRGMTGRSRALLFMEWSAPSTTTEEDLYNPDVIAQANPALGYRQSLDALLNEAEGMRVSGYKQERLGIPMMTTATSLFDSEDWEKQTVEFDGEQPPIDPEQLVLALDIPPDRSTATITAAYFQDGRLFVEVIDRREGVQWVPMALNQLKKLSAYPVIYDVKGQAGSLADQFVLTRTPSRAITFQELLKAAGLFFDHVNEKKVFHIGQDELSEAIKSAKVKPSGDRWKFDRGDADISPLVSASFALYFLLLFTKGNRTSAQNTNKKKRRVRL